MKIYIIGAGAIGKTLAVFLKINGKDVELIRGSFDEGSPYYEKITLHLKDDSQLKAKIKFKTFINLPVLDGLIILTNKSFRNAGLSKKLKGKIQDTRILGPRSNFAEYVHPQGSLAFGITFQFGSTLPIFQEEVKVLTNKIILPDDILPSVNWLTSCFQNTKLDVFLGYLNNCIGKRNYEVDRNGFALWKQFLDLLFSGKNYATCAGKLSKELGISQRHLQRVTLKYSGFTPKRVQSMLRCRLAIRHIRRTGLINDFFFYGYYDQNHFIKEVKRWSGHTPKQLLSFLN